MVYGSVRPGPLFVQGLRRFLSVTVFRLLAPILLVVLYSGNVSAQDVESLMEVNCSAFGNATTANPIVTIEVPAGASYVGRCRSDAVDPAQRLPTTVEVKVRFQCGPGSRLLLDGWRQLNGSLEIVPALGASALHGVRVETTNNVHVRATASGHALSLLAAAISATSLVLGPGTTLEGLWTCGSFVGPSNTAFNVTDSSITVGENCLVSTLGYAAAAIVFDGYGFGNLLLWNVTFLAQWGSEVYARGAWSRSQHVAALGASASTLAAFRCTLSAQHAVIEAGGQSAVAALAFMGLSGDDAAELSATHVAFHVTSSNITSIAMNIGAATVSFVACSRVLSAGLVPRPAISNVTVDSVSWSIVSSNVTAIGIEAIASAGVVSYSYNGSLNIGGGFGMIAASNVQLMVASSTIGAYAAAAWGTAMGSVAILCYGAIHGCTVISNNVTFQVESSTVFVSSSRGAILSAVSFAFFSRSKVNNNTMVIRDAALRVAKSNVTVFGSGWFASAGIIGIGNVTVEAFTTDIQSSNVAGQGDGSAIACAGVVVLGEANLLSQSINLFTSGASLYARLVTLFATKSNITATGGNGIGAVGFVTYNYAVGNSDMISTGGNITAQNVTLSVQSSRVVTSGNYAVASAGFAVHDFSNGAGGATIRAADVRCRIVSSNISASASEAVASAAMVAKSGSISPSLLVVTATSLVVLSSSVTVTARNSGARALASAGFASVGGGQSSEPIVSSIVAVDIVVTSVLSSVSAVGGDAVVSCGFVSYSTEGVRSASSIIIEGANFIISSSTINASGRDAVASAAVANVAVGTSTSNLLSLQLSDFAVSVCQSQVTAAGRYAVAAVGAASPIVVTSTRTKLSISGSAVVAGGVPGVQYSRCGVGTSSCGLHSSASLLAAIVNGSATSPALPSNRLVVLDSWLGQLSNQSTTNCANVGDARLFDAVLVANTSFNCSEIGWGRPASASIAPDSAVCVDLRGLNASVGEFFPGASADPNAAAGPLRTLDVVRNETETVCGSRLRGVAPLLSGVASMTPTRMRHSGTHTTTASLFGRSRISTASPKLSNNALSLSTATTVVPGGRSSTHPCTASRTHQLSPTMAQRPPPKHPTEPQRTHTLTDTASFFVSMLTDNPLEVNPARVARLDFAGTAVVSGATGVALVATAAAGLVGLPVASRPAVVGAAIRLSACVGDGDGPEVPPYEAMPVQFAVLDTRAGTSALATATNAAFVGLCIGGAYAFAPSHEKALETQADGGVSLRASFVHVVATVPFSYIAPALMEFSVSWLTAAADAMVESLGLWWLCFAAGCVSASGGWLLLLWRARPVTSGAPSQFSRLPAASISLCPASVRWALLVGPLLRSTRDPTVPLIRYAFFVELGTGLLFSSFSGVRIETLCVAKCVAATLVAVGFLGYLLIVKPAAERMDHWFSVMFAVLQTVTGTLVTAAVAGTHSASDEGQSSASWTTSALDGAETVSVATLGLLVVQSVVGLVVALRQRSRRDAGNAQSDGSMTLSLLAVPTMADCAPAPRTAQTSDHATVVGLCTPTAPVRNPLIAASGAIQQQ
jgi:uncharacterized membrane protein